jgi:hypothetical protein
MSGVGGSAKDYTGMSDAFVKIFKNEARDPRARRLLSAMIARARTPRMIFVAIPLHPT